MLSKRIRVLGIETSCDETAAAVVEAGRTVLSNIVASSLKEHAKYGGIIPEIASRRQIELIQGVVGEALKQAGTTLDDISAVAVTQSPGLIGSLLVGISYAKALAFAAKKPLMDVNHIHAHLYANFLTLPGKPNTPGPDLPAVGLVVSGGHSSLFYIKDFRHFEQLGQTRDDAAGEAFDKVARILNLGYPGGPVIDRLAKKGTPGQISFPAAELPGCLDFSFSGTKTAVLYYTRKNQGQIGFSLENVACAFQDSVISVLVKKSLAACRKKKCGTLIVGGGVAANSGLRDQLATAAAREGLRVHVPPMGLCLDNAAMVAGMGHHLFKRKSLKKGAGRE
ncbi:MAG: tRNA (adenosine(37)-N6)-threonylcarbamoyltransferase complex transferase subunit TsaD [Candidatus Omnitrophota bacterium]|nr:tRNA (adenosine(37)-N6)-threonylcarbamoyltransferase complex transferase subunit TsaD [Candidatus Omnitrophota bacterium]MDZ4243140.1 tRNA (adenosine(37)-N6)-threonylcarbamoyltransferase complex transferase subunit TsaD [Candidatus Omnitrophota bacterium]